LSPRDRADGLRPRRPFPKKLTSIRRKVIAIVDDDPGVRTAAARLLSAFGFGTETYGSAQEFLNAAATSEAVCLVIDIQLGGASGLDLARQLAVDGCKHAIIFMTAVDGDMVRSEAAAAGGVAILSKPFPARALIEAVIKATG
jgi:FixJ family two-component response regulator